MRACPSCHSIYTAHVAHCSIDGHRLVEAKEDPLVGRELDRYQILERIGVGAMGCVYRAAHRVLDREYAVKVLFGDIGSNEKVARRFQREARAVSKMTHPNILSITDFGTSRSGLTFLVMERLTGKTLATLLEEEGPLSWARVGGIAHQIAAGLAHAHGEGFVHRDVKPANVMVTREADMEFVKILDFGLVGILESCDAPSITGADAIIGTPLYMAPEQARNAHEATPSADLYSLGVCMYEMLAGVPPFEAEKTVDVLIKHVLEPAPPLPPAHGLELLVDWLLQKEAVDRPNSAREVTLELERITGTPASTKKKPISSPFAETVEIEVDLAAAPRARKHVEALYRHDTNDTLEGPPSFAD